MFLILGAVAFLTLVSAAVSALLGQAASAADAWAPDPVQDRLFLSPTGRAQPVDMARQGGVYLFLAPYGAVAPTGGVQLSAGSPILFGLFQVHETGLPFWVGGKVRAYRGEGLDVSVAGTYMTSTDGDDGSLGIVQALATLGSPRGGVTLGMGQLFGNPFDRGPALLTVGGDFRVNEKLKLLAESHWPLVANTKGGLVMAGPRFLNGAAAVEVMMMAHSGPGGVEFLPLPLLSVSYGW